MVCLRTLSVYDPCLFELYNNNGFRFGLFKLFFPLIGQLDPEVKFHSIGILSEDFGEIVTPLPVEENHNGRTLFTLREGSRYQLKLQFSVMHNLVSGLTYSNTVWKGGLQGTHLVLFFLSLLLVKLVYIGFLWLTCYKNWSIIILKVEGRVQKTITINLI